MSNIAVCYKWVWDDADIRINPQSRQLDFSKAVRKISEYDRNVLEAGVQLKTILGGAGQIFGITCGMDADASAKDALSRGADSVLLVSDKALEDADSQLNAKVLAALVKGADDVKVVLCGEGSSDEYAQQTGARLAALLDWPVVSNVNKIALNSDKLILVCKMEEGEEVVEAALPLVINVLPEIFEAPIPGFKQIMGAKKKPVQAKSLAELGIEINSPLTIVSVLAPDNPRQGLRLNPEGVSLAEAARQLVKELLAQGVA